MDAAALIEQSASFAPAASCRGFGWIRVHVQVALAQTRSSSPDEVEFLDLSSNNLATPRSLTPLAPFTRLRAVSLAGNEISDPAGLAFLPPSLDTLILSDNQLTALPDLGTMLPRLRWLDAARNGLSDCVGLFGCVGLLAAELSGNVIRRLDGLEQLGQLRALGLGGNRLADEQALRPLSLNAALQSLSLSGNPVATRGGAGLRYLLQNLLPALRWLQLEPAARAEGGWPTADASPLELALALAPESEQAPAPAPAPAPRTARRPRRSSAAAPATGGASPVGAGVGTARARAAARSPPVGRSAEAARSGAEAAAALRLEVEAHRQQRELDEVARREAKRAHEREAGALRRAAREAAAEGDAWRERARQHAAEAAAAREEVAAARAAAAASVAEAARWRARAEEGEAALREAEARAGALAAQLAAVAPAAAAARAGAERAARERDEATAQLAREARAAERQRDAACRALAVSEAAAREQWAGAVEQLARAGAAGAKELRSPPPSPPQPPPQPPPPQPLGSPAHLRSPPPAAPTAPTPWADTRHDAIRLRRRGKAASPDAQGGAAASAAAREEGAPALPAALPSASAERVACAAVELAALRDATWRQCDAAAAREEAARAWAQAQAEAHAAAARRAARPEAAPRERGQPAEAQQEELQAQVGLQEQEGPEEEEGQEPEQRPRDAATTHVAPTPQRGGGDAPGGGAGVAQLGATLRQLLRAEEAPNPLLLPTLQAQLSAQLKQLVYARGAEAGALESEPPAACAASPGMGNATAAFFSDVLDYYSQEPDPADDLDAAGGDGADVDENLIGRRASLASGDREAF